MSHSGFSRVAIGLVATISTLIALVPSTSAQPVAPKAYVGLFGDNTVGVIDTATNTLTRTIPIPNGPHGLVITPDGKWVYASSDGDSKVSVIDTRRDEVTASIEVGATPHGLAITPDGSRVLVAGFGSNLVEAIDTGTNKLVWQTPVPQPHNIAITPDGQTAYAGSQQQDSPSLAIIDIASGTITGSIPLDHAPRALTASPDGADVAFTQAGVDSVQVLDVASNQIDVRIPTGASPHHPLFSVDGKIGMVVSQGPGDLELFDPGSYATIAAIKVGAMPHWIATTSANQLAYVSNEKSNDVSVVDLTSRAVVATVPVGNAPRKIVVQPGTVAAQVAQSGTAAAQGSVPVNIAKFAFSPATLTINAGQSVTWTNSDAVAHTATSDDGSWDAGSIDPQASFTRTFAQPGTYAYHCAIHPFMRATIVVK